MMDGVFFSGLRPSKTGYRRRGFAVGIFRARKDAGHACVGTPAETGILLKRSRKRSCKSDQLWDSSCEIEDRGVRTARTNDGEERATVVTLAGLELRQRDEDRYSIQ